MYLTALVTTYIVLHISELHLEFQDRLARQRNIKRQQSQQPIVKMPKSEVEEKRLGDFVVMPVSMLM